MIRKKPIVKELATERVNPNSLGSQFLLSAKLMELEASRRNTRSALSPHAM